MPGRFEYLRSHLRATMDALVRLRSPWERQSAWALAPATAIALAFYVLAIAWMALISTTNADLAPTGQFVGLHQYHRLATSDRWWAVNRNLAVYATLVILGASAGGYVLAAVLQRGVRFGAFFHFILTLPLSMSFVVAGVTWQMLLNPSIGIQQTFRSIGLSEWSFDWLVRADRVILVVSLVTIWQQIGLCMALFLMGMRRIDLDIWNALRLDGASVYRAHLQVIAPILVPNFLVALLVLASTTLRTFDLILVMTSGGPGFASDMPAHFIIEAIMERQDLALGAAGATMLLLLAVLAAVPYGILSRRPNVRL